MIGHLQGALLRLAPDRALIDVGGVGYEVHVSLATFAELSKAGTERVAVHVHTHVRDDAIQLFGFWSERERTLFERLITVSGIGPRLAQAVLSGITVEELALAISKGDEARLQRVPGVGKKTAARMVVELGDRVADLIAPRPTPSPATVLEDDLISALVNLGYRPADAEKALSRARNDAPALASADLLRAALRLLARV